MRFVDDGGHRAATSAEWIAIAEQHVRAREHGEAIRTLLRAAQLVPDNSTVLYNLGALYLATDALPEAIVALRRSIALDPSFARAHLLLGLALQRTGEEDGALSAYRRAILIGPDLVPEARALLADLLWDNGRREEAVASYERASAFAPATTFGRMCAAKALSARRGPHEALEALTQLVLDDPSCSEAHMTRGHHLCEVGRFDDAAASYERAIALAPELAGAHLGLVSCKRLTEADRPWLARILSRIASSDNGVRQRMTLHFAAGKALEDLRDYEGAIEHFEAANRIRRKLGRPLDREGLDALVETLTARFRRESFSPGEMQSGEETPLLVLGLPRSGTTLIERILSAHPQVGGGGELGFWSERGPAWFRATHEALGEIERGLPGDYLRLLRTVSPNALRVTDKNTFNWPWVGLFHRLFPRARVVHCRRNPADTCLAIYTAPLAYNWGFASDRGDLAAYYRAYLRMVAHWRSVLPSDRWLDIDYEDVTDAPERVARRLIAFAGLAWDPVCLSPERNPEPVKTMSHWQARQPIYRTSVGRWMRYEPWLGELRSLVSP